MGDSKDFLVITNITIRIKIWEYVKYSTIAHTHDIPTYTKYRCYTCCTFCFSWSWVQHSTFKIHLLKYLKVFIVCKIGFEHELSDNAKPI